MQSICIESDDLGTESNNPSKPQDMPALPECDPEERSALVELYLEHLWIDKTKLSEDLLSKLNPDALEGVCNSLQGIRPQIFRAILSNNPELLDPDGDLNFPAFVNNLKEIVSSGHANNGYKMFDPEKNLESFSNPITLRKLLKASRALSLAKSLATSDQKGNG